MSQESSTFIIIREDRGVDPTTLVVEALRIGRDPDSELLLNHPTISRQQAGIKEIEGHFYLFHFSSTNATDRKSTRLNSSHSQISYAVFCLKKKKKTEQLLLSLGHKLSARCTLQRFTLHRCSA